MSYRKLYVGKPDEVLLASNNDTLGRVSRAVAAFINLEEATCTMLVEFYDDQSAVSRYNSGNGNGASVSPPKDSIDLLVEEQIVGAKKQAQKEEEILGKLDSYLVTKNLRDSPELVQSLAEQYDESPIFIEELGNSLIEEEEKKKRRQERKSKGSKRK